MQRYCIIYIYIYIMSLFFLIIKANFQDHQIELYILYSTLVAITSDIGGLVIGKTFKEVYSF